MAENSAIEWTDHTFNPWEGCQKVSPGCDNCYAENRNARFGGGMAVNWGPGAPRRRTSESNWNKPLQWNARHEEFFAVHLRRQRVFCASLADVFDNDVPTKWRVELLALMGACEHLDWLLLTKRVGNVTRLLCEAAELAHERGMPAVAHWITAWLDGDAPPHVWIGATVCNQTEADRDVPKLLQVPARVRFLSIEPMLGPINVGLYLSRTNMPGLRMMPGFRDSLPGIDWVICGGESGPKARPMHPSWVRSLRDQCAAAGVPFLFKQHGEWLATTFCDDDMAMLPSKRTAYVRLDGSTQDGSDGIDFFGGDEEVAWVGKKAAGRLLDGKLHDAYPHLVRLYRRPAP